MSFLLHIRHAFWLIQFHLIIKNESKIIKMEKTESRKITMEKNDFRKKSNRIWEKNQTDFLGH